MKTDKSKEAIAGLEPASVWERFYDISRIPRESGNEEGVRTHILDYARGLGLEAAADRAGNVIIKKPASQGYEDKPTVILQGHLDMVCEKNRGTEHDFAVDPIRLVREGDWITAYGTTLGADNGVAIAMALAILEDNSLEHGPLETLFTIEEETGLTGAMEFDPSLLSGTILLNLDSEEEKVLWVGCAGGVNTEGTLPVKREPAPSGYELYQLSVAGLHGGHSGAEIHKGLGNAILMAARILKYIGSETGARLVSLEGGGKQNAIPRECFAGLLIDPADISAVEKIIAVNRAGYTADYGVNEPEISITLDKMDGKSDSVLDAESFRKAVDLLYSMPHGIVELSRVMKDLVETSTNLAAAELREDHLYVLTSQRASSNFLRDDIRDRVMSCFSSAGGTSRYFSTYPGWKPDLNSKILAISKDAYKRLNGHEPELKAIHAGLECGVIGDKFPGLDMISIGPDMEGIHTPDEKLSISSLEREWKFILEILKAV